MQLGGQMRIINNRVTGWDMTAAIALARASGVDERAAAFLLPEVEGGMVMKINANRPQGEAQ